MIIESISKLKNRKDFRASGIVPGMLNAAGQAVDMVNDLVNQIIEKEFFHLNVNCYKGKGNALEILN